MVRRGHLRVAVKRRRVYCSGRIGHKSPNIQRPSSAKDLVRDPNRQKWGDYAGSIQVVDVNVLHVKWQGGEGAGSQRKADQLPPN